jgi:hypothetical protein
MKNFDLLEEITIEIEPEEQPIATGKNRKPEEKKFSAGFYLRCTKAEKAAVEAEAAHFNMSISRFGIARMLYPNRVLTREEMEVLGGIVQELGALGNNVNQIASNLNAAALHGQTIELSQKQLFALTLEIQNLVSEFKAEAKKLWRS